MVGSKEIDSMKETPYQSEIQKVERYREISNSQVNLSKKYVVSCAEYEKLNPVSYLHKSRKPVLAYREGSRKPLDLENLSFNFSIEAS